jgi:hypothetical protein
LLEKSIFREEALGCPAMQDRKEQWTSAVTDWRRLENLRLLCPIDVYGHCCESVRSLKRAFLLQGGLIAAQQKPRPKAGPENALRRHTIPAIY